MMITQYLKKIKTLCIAENSNHTGLDNPAVKIPLGTIAFYFNLSDLEFKNNQQKTGSDEMILNPEIISQISKCLGLEFVNKKQTEGNVCFINSTELRTEFRQSFTSVDVLDYCFAVLYFSINKISEINSARIPITSDSSVFWKLVKYGRELYEKSN